MNPVDYSGLSVLVIDDMNTARKFAQNTLLQLKFDRSKITMVKNAKDAIAAIHEKGSFDLILCDYNLGAYEINGQQILETLKNKKLMSNETVFFMVSAESNLQMVSAALEFTPDHYISKPYQPKFLSDRINDSLLKKKMMSFIFKLEFSGAIDKAIYMCDKTIIQYPKIKSYILKHKAHLLKTTNKFAEAGIIYSALSKEQPDNYTHILHFAECQLSLGNIDTANTLLLKVVNKNSKTSKAYDLLSVIEEKKNNLLKSQEYKKIAVQISPNSIERQEDLVRLAEINNDIETIEKSMQNIIKLDNLSFDRDYSRHLKFIHLKLENYLYSKVKIDKKTLISFSHDIRKILKNFPKIEQKEKIKIIICDLLINLLIKDVLQSANIYKRIKDYDIKELFKNNFFGIIFEHMFNLDMKTQVEEILKNINIYEYPGDVFEKAYFNLISNNLQYEKKDIVKQINRSGIKYFEQKNYINAYHQFSKAVEKELLYNLNNYENISTSIVLNSAQSLQSVINKNLKNHNMDIIKESHSIQKLLNNINQTKINLKNKERLSKISGYYQKLNLHHKRSQ